MKKFVKRAFVLCLVLIMVFMFAACNNTSDKDTSGNIRTSTPSDSSGGSSTGNEASDVGKKGDAGKIAVIRNMSTSDHTAQFFAGCIAEGEALGYTVDTFISDQDDVVMKNLMEQALEKDYDIWIISHANEGYQHELVSQAVDKGVSVVGFDCGGEPVPGVTYTSQNDLSLAQLSLDGMIERAKELGAEEPIKFGEINILGLIVPFDTRHDVIEEYVADSKMQVVELISPNLSADTYSQIYTAVTTVLNNNPGILGIWAASSGLLDGAIDAVADAGRQDDVVFTAIDISDTELVRMTNVSGYYCCAAVDPYVIGVVDVRLAVMKQLGLETPDEYKFEAVNIYGSMISEDDSMQTLDKYFTDFGSTDVYDVPEIQEQRVQYAG